MDHEQAFRAVLLVDPDNADVRLAFATWLRKHGRVDEADQLT